MVHELRGVASPADISLDVFDWGEDLVAMVLVVIFSMFSVLKFHLELVESVHDVPLELQNSESLAGAEGTKGNDRVFHLLAVLIELGINKAVVFELLQIHKEEKRY